MKIAFCGKMRAGKDTACNFLKSAKRSERFNFADPLYEMQDAIYKIAGLEKLEEGQKDRKLLQLLGTEWGRQTIDPDLWMNIFKNRVHYFCDQVGTLVNIINTDARFENEINLLKFMGFTVVYISATDETCESRGATFTNHESERYIKDFKDYDFIVENNGTLESYYDKLDSIFQELAKKG